MWSLGKYYLSLTSNTDEGKGDGIHLWILVVILLTSYNEKSNFASLIVEWGKLWF